MAAGPGLRVRGLSVVSGRDLKCGCCGICCKTYSKVDVSITDIFNIAAFLGIGADEFFTGYCKTMSDAQDSAVFLLDIEGGCRFQKDGKCTIYPVRTDMCAMYPFNLMCLNTSQSLKKDLARFESCFVRSLPDDLIIVPDIERMADSRIMFMVKEMYLARYGSTFREEDALEYHRKGLAQVQNERMRNIVHMQLLNEFLKAPPLDEDTKEPLMTAGEIRQIYNQSRGLPRV
jgi:Fe-S-cluster containining protein